MTSAPNARLMSYAGSTGNDSKLSLFARTANAVSQVTGKPATFAVCCLSIVVWGATGPFFHYSDTWQLIINTGTTIVTFLMVFLIQNTQNREGAALQAKLDELIRATQSARNELVALERLPEEEVQEVRESVARQAAGEG
jgi:low affinity Fe/Cu permease